MRSKLIAFSSLSAVIHACYSSVYGSSMPLKLARVILDFPAIESAAESNLTSRSAGELVENTLEVSSFSFPNALMETESEQQRLLFW